MGRTLINYQGNTTKKTVTDYNKKCISTDTLLDSLDSRNKTDLLNLVITNGLSANYINIVE